MALSDTIKGMFGSSPIPKYKKIVEKINALEASVSVLIDTDFPEKTKDLKARRAKGASFEELLPEAFALVREASKRTLGQRHYDVQLLGGIVLNSGTIAEMRTGEGKTLVATLAAYLNALDGLGVHVVTVNDYLAQRDGAWMGQIYSFLGLTLGVINSQNLSYKYDPTPTEVDGERDLLGSFKVEHEFLKVCSRRDAYACDITYGTNNEFGFDYLRDNLAQVKEALVQRGHYYAVVDEIDSILIDESRTPLIIAGESGASANLYQTFAKISKQLIKDTDYTVDEKHRSIALSDTGITKAEKLLGISNIYTDKGIKYVHHLETAVRAEALFHIDKDYVVKSGEIVIVDSFTGRLQPGRRWNEGLHQAIEAKEGVRIKEETRAVASITFQNYFRFYKKLSGMTGTAKTSEEEFQKVYNLSVVTVPTHRDTARTDHPDLVFQTEKGKYAAMIKRIKELHEKGQPVLVGTVSIDKNELLSAYLTAAGVPHEVLNAKNHEREGEIIAQAGRKGAVTIATNMAGRGVDIILGGQPKDDTLHKAVGDVGGLFVIGTERHEARRIDNQLRGRAGRQGDSGETQFYISLQDELMRVFATDSLKNLMGRFGIPEDEPIVNRFVSRAIESAQGKIEGLNFDARKYTLEYDTVLNTQREAIYSRRRTMLLSSNVDVLAFIEKIWGNDEEAKKIFAEKRELLGEELFADTMRRIILYSTDALWTEHIETMDYMRSSVNLRAYGQREPIVEYKKEGLRLFKELEATFYRNVIELARTISKNENPAPTVAVEAVSGEKIERNDPCPCGSGKKWKKCGMIGTEEHNRLMAQKK